MTSNPLFYIIPLVSAVSNIYLLLTLLSAKKSKVINSLIMLLLAFSVWTLSSLFMRLNLNPGVVFWFQASMTAIIFVPLLMFTFLKNYSEKRGTFLSTVFTVGTILMAVLNLLSFFISDPKVFTGADGEVQFTYSIRWPAVFLLVFALVELIACVKLVVDSINKDGKPGSSYRPIIIGTAILFVSMLLDLIPGVSSVFPVDPFACMINAFLLYYMLYRKRMLSLVQFASNSSNLLASAVISSLIVITGYGAINRVISTYLNIRGGLVPYVSAAACSLLTVLVFSLLRVLTDNIFVKKHTSRETLLKDFSVLVNRNLDEGRIIDLFVEMIRENSSCDCAYVFIKGSDGNYKLAASTDKMSTTEYIIRADSPLVKALAKNKVSVSYHDFFLTPSSKAMWEGEKHLLERLKSDIFFPIIAEDNLIGLTIFSVKNNNQPYSFEEISFMESVSSIVSISIKNADLYETIKKEAHLDMLTGLYNRSHFTSELSNMIQNDRLKSVSMLLISLDDFKLFNELYGAGDSDNMLCAFADILRTVIGNRGMLARSGKEFWVSLQLCSSDQAQDYDREIRRKLDSYLKSLPPKSQKNLTYSAGICNYPESAANHKELISFANMAVFSAKKTGKNKTVVYSKQSGSSDIQNLSAENLEAIGREYTQTIYALTASIDAKDHYTFTHSENVSRLSSQLAQAIGLDREHVEMIRQAGLLHDIGKISIPESILSKPTKLTDEEYDIMKGHVMNSVSIIRHLPSLDFVVPIVIGHHERWDGRGYPRGLSKTDIPVGARCMAIADSFDAIASRRAYKNPVPVADSIAEIERCLGTQFDPEIGRVFVDLVRSGEIDTSNYNNCN